MNRKKLMLIYNPFSGRRRLITQLDTAFQIFQQGGYHVSVHRTESPEDIEHAAMESEDFDTVVIAGGDGSIHQAVNGLMKIPAEKRPMLGILPVGTANDLSVALNLPKGIQEACEVIVRGSSFEMDLGQVNDRYFVNVFSAGLLTDVSPKVDVRIKNRLGQLAYYLKGIETLPSFRPFHVEFEFQGMKYSEDAFLMLALNGPSAGGFRHLVPQASLNDGLLDFLLVKQSGWQETMTLLLQLVGGSGVEHERIEFFQADSLHITTDRPISSDLDGEWGPESPWTIRVGSKVTILR